MPELSLFFLQKLKFKIVVSQLLSNLYMRDIGLNCIFFGRKTTISSIFLNDTVVNQIYLTKHGRLLKIIYFFNKPNIVRWMQNFKMFQTKVFVIIIIVIFSLFNYPCFYLPVYPRRSIYLIIYLYICLFSIFLSI